ncbi:MAG: hypothetical protein V7746_07115 [Halioglobus sp.]
MIDELFAKFAGAFAENTIKAYRADFERFSQCCFEKGVDPLQAKPKAPAVVLAMKRLYREKGRAQKQAIPVTRDVLAGRVVGHQVSTGAASCMTVLLMTIGTH